MLNILRMGLGAGGRERLEEMIIKESAQGERSYLIVPEQQTVLSESRMAKLLPGDAPLYFEVTNFTRFSNSTFRALGGICGESCDRSRSALIMWRTLTELSPMLNMTEGRKEISAGLVEAAQSAVTEMQMQSITPEMLEQAATDELKQNHRRLHGKLSDLSKIFSLYKKILGERYSDSGDETEQTVKLLEQNPEFLKDAKIYIEGFTSFTEPQYKLIARLACRANVTVHLPLSKLRSDAFEYTEIRAAETKLKFHAKRVQADVRITSEDGMRNTDREALAIINDLLWQKNTKIDNISLQNPDEIRIIEARTPFEECEFICSDIKRRVMEGASYSDMAIVHGSTGSYNGILDTTLMRCEIPAFLSRTKDASEYEAIKLIYTAYAVALYGFRREDVLTFAKCGLSGVGREACDEFELYVNTWQISGSRFTDGLIWNMNPQGYSLHRDESTDKKLVRINETKNRLITPLLSFAEKMRDAHTVRAHAELLYNFLTSINLEQGLKERALKLAKLGEGEYAEENLKLWGLICNSLDIIVEVGEDTPADGDSFLGQLRILFSSASISHIPAHTDEVTVGSAEMLRLFGKKHIYLIGVNAGEFPAAAVDNSFFSERDKLALCAVGLEMEPQLEIKNARELFIFSRAISYASESITLSYSVTGGQLKAIEPSAVIGRIMEILPQLEKVRVSGLTPKERLWFAEDALRLRRESYPDVYPTVKDALNRSGYGDKLKISEGSIAAGNSVLGEDVRRRLYEGTLSLSETKINAFNACPFNYFCKYILKLSEEASAQFDAANIGSFIHSILENFIKTVKERDLRVEELTEQERREMTRRSAEGYIADLGENVAAGKPETKVKIERLCRAAFPVVDALCDELEKSAFSPMFFELPIGRNGGPEAPTVISEGGKTKVYGIIDRVDSYTTEGKTYLRVIDYKTGKKEFDPSDVERGENLQMFLYLKALIESEDENFRKTLGLKEGERAIPAGLIYVKTSVADVRVPLPDDDAALQQVKKNQQREGMVTDDESIIRAMGIPNTPLYDARYPDKIPDSKRKYTFSEEGWNKLMQTVEKSLCDVADRMRSGDVSASARFDKDGDTHCEYCEYKPICRNALIN